MCLFSSSSDTSEVQPRAESSVTSSDVESEDEELNVGAIERDVEQEEDRGDLATAIKHTSTASAVDNTM